MTINDHEEDNNLNQSRRNTVLGLLGATGSVAAWHKPIIDAVFLPAHAQTSAGLPSSFFNASALLTHASPSSPLDWVINSANAGTGPSMGDSFGLSATKIDETRYTIDHLSIDRTVYRSGVLIVPGEGDASGPDGQLSYVSGSSCEGIGGTPRAIPARMLMVNDSEMQIEIDTRSEGSFVLSMSVGDGFLMAECGLMGDSFASNDLISSRKSISSAQPSLGESLLDMVIPPAVAGVVAAIGITELGATAERNGDGSYDVNIYGHIPSESERTADYNSHWFGTLTIGDRLRPVAKQLGCEPDAEARIYVGGDSDLVVEIDSEIGGNSRPLFAGEFIAPMLQDLCGV